MRAPSSPPYEVNMMGMVTILKNTFGPTAPRADGMLVSVRRGDVMPAARATFSMSELCLLMDEDGLRFAALLDVELTDIDTRKVAEFLFEVNHKVPFGNFQIKDGNVVFFHGICGATATEIPGIVLADSLVYVMNMADAGQDFLRRKLRSRVGRSGAKRAMATKPKAANGKPLVKVTPRPKNKK